MKNELDRKVTAILISVLACAGSDMMAATTRMPNPPERPDAAIIHYNPIPRVVFSSKNLKS